jgi:hypothetical protein
MTTGGMHVSGGEFTVARLFTERIQRLVRGPKGKRVGDKWDGLAKLGGLPRKNENTSVPTQHHQRLIRSLA